MTQVQRGFVNIHSQFPPAESKVSCVDACSLHEENECNFVLYCASDDDKANHESDSVPVKKSFGYHETLAIQLLDYLLLNLSDLSDPLLALLKYLFKSPINILWYDFSNKAKEK